ncbi:MAG: peptidylprolyl isomerase [Phenylobacterium sp.]
MAAIRPIRPALAAGVLLAAALALTACGKGGTPAHAPERGDVAVAKVGGDTIWSSDVKREAVAQGLIGEGEPLEVSSDLFHRVLDEVVDQRLLAAEAVRRRLDKDPAAQRRLTAARDRVLGDLLVENVVADAVSDNAVRGLYAEQQKLAKRSEEIHARQIVTATETEAEAVKKLLAAGASFEGLAMEKSIDPATRFSGGDMGYFTTDVMPEAYDVALKTAKPGQVVGPFPVAGGFAVVKVEDRRLEQPISLEAARPQIVRFLTYDQIRDLLEKLRSRSKVELMIKSDTPAKSLPPADAPKLAPAPPAEPPPAAALRGGKK